MLIITLKQKKEKHKRMLTLRLITSLLYECCDKEQEIQEETEYARANQQFHDSLWSVSRSLACIGWIYAPTSRENTRELSTRSKHNLFALVGCFNLRLTVYCLFLFVACFCVFKCFLCWFLWFIVIYPSNMYVKVAMWLFQR